MKKLNLFLVALFLGFGIKTASAAVTPDPSPTLVPVEVPLINSITPNKITANTVRTISIIGSKFSTSTSQPLVVNVGTTKIPSSDVTVISSNLISFKTPKLAIGTYDITVINGPAIYAMLPKALTVEAAIVPPVNPCPSPTATPVQTVTSITPQVLKQTGGEHVIIKGTNFFKVSDVKIGNIRVKNLISPDCMTIEFDTVDMGTPGKKALEITSMDGIVFTFPVFVVESEQTAAPAPVSTPRRFINYFDARKGSSINMNFAVTDSGGIELGETSVSASAKTHHVQIDIINMRGELVRENLVDQDMTVGPQTVSWNGKNDSDTLVAADQYILRIKVDGSSKKSEKIIFVR